MAKHVKGTPAGTHRGRPPLPDDELVEEIKAIICDMPTNGYRCAHSVIKLKARASGKSWPNVKWVYWVMKDHNLLLQRHTGDSVTRTHEGKVSVVRSNLRW